MSISSDNFYKKHITDVTEWQKMGEAGIFPPESRLELINGEIIEMAPIGSPHASHLNRLNKLLSDLVQESAIVSIQNPIQLSDLSEPQPDLTLLHPNSDFYYENHPHSKGCFLINRGCR